MTEHAWLVHSVTVMSKIQPQKRLEAALYMVELSIEEASPGGGRGARLREVLPVERSW